MFLENINGWVRPKKFKILITEMVLLLDQYKHIFWKSVHTRLWDKSPGVFERIIFAQLSENFTGFENSQ